MFNMWLLLMFGSGMPLLYLVGVIWLVVVELLDRHALARLCRRPVRYGPRLPYLLLGEWGGSATLVEQLAAKLHTRPEYAHQVSPPKRTHASTADVLPWAAACHCAIGLWMHTYHYTFTGLSDALTLDMDSANAAVAIVANRWVDALITCWSRGVLSADA